MKNNLIGTLLIIIFSKTYSQISNVDLITKQNDTIRNQELKINYFSKVELNYKLQEKVTIKEKDGTIKEYFPSDLKSFSLKLNDETLNYESIEDKFFAQPMYSNKIKLYRFIKPGYTPVNFYLVKRPNGNISYMEAMGLGRLISKKVIIRELSDCKSTIEKMENKILKVQGESGVIELIKDYENSCY